jgi:predicted nucleic acid-binding protein
VAQLVRQSVYLDTDVLVNCVYPDMPDAGASQRAVQLLRETQSRVFLSAITAMEYAQAFRSLATRGTASRAVILEFELGRWNEASIRHRWMTFWRDELERFRRSLPDCVELPITPEINHQSFDLVARYALRSQDAVHLATALHYEIPVFWTCDDHFSRVDELHVAIIRDGA